ncbi:MAG: sugar transferase [Gemmatimonadales bacterium]
MPLTLPLPGERVRGLTLLGAWSSPFGVPEPPARRWLNAAVAFVGLVVTLPLILVIAALVRVSSPGPILYTQPRVGLNRRRHRRAAFNGRRQDDCGGRPFAIYKFRTMRPAPRNGDLQVWAGADEARITPIGRWLRRTHLDELPQLFNVLLGDMNVVGPRPEQPSIFGRLKRDLTAYGRRQLVRPGITGWAQVNLPYDQTLDDVRRKLTFDLEYLRRQSAAEDLRIMWRTLPVMFQRRGR